MAVSVPLLPSDDDIVASKTEGKSSARERRRRSIRRPGSGRVDKRDSLDLNAMVRSDESPKGGVLPSSPGLPFLAQTSLVESFEVDDGGSMSTHYNDKKSGT